ncbi:MAG: glycoside hydrolase family 1 protein [Chloroflexi bacterium]|nr:glycoside hydrolase family 1 protein [Chloroflexota bacterium]
MVDFDLHFPAGFLWGTATAAHQVEGGNTNNNWHAWETSGPGHVFENQQAGAACDWWDGQRYLEDFDRAAEMRNNAHRFSVEWSRIEPEPGQYDDAALQHYADMVSALRARSMEPLVTLHHFSNPLWLEKQGGWTNETAVGHFEQFVARVVEALGENVTLWCTINEPMVYASQSFLTGHFPPGKKNLVSTYRVIANLLRGHAAAYRAIKAQQPNAQVGLAKHQISFKVNRPQLIHAPAHDVIRHFFNRAIIGGLLTGKLRLPLRTFRVPEAKDTLDWIGLNYYYRFAVGFHPLYPQQFFIRQSRPKTGILGPESVGEIWPEGLFEHIRWLSDVTRKPLYITENGVADPDDTLRPLHMVRSLCSVWQAINYNAPVKGYFHWTLVDNIEWSEGYDPRFQFGLHTCDRETQERAKRRSAELYGEICALNAFTGDMAQRYVPDQFDELFPGVDVQANVPLDSPDKRQTNEMNRI